MNEKILEKRVVKMEIVLNHQSPKRIRKKPSKDVSLDQILKAKCGWWNSDPKDNLKWRLLARKTDENSVLVKGKNFRGEESKKSAEDDHDLKKLWKTKMDDWF